MSGESGFRPLTEQTEAIKPESDLQPENVSAPERKDTECCDAVVRQYGDAFWVCCSKCTHKLGKIINVDEFMSQAHLNFRSNAHLARRSTSSMQRLRWKCWHSTRRKKIRCESKQNRRLQAKSTRKTNVPIVMIGTLASKEDIYWENLKKSNFAKTHFRVL